MMPNREFNESESNGEKWRRWANFHAEDLADIKRDIKMIKSVLHGDGERAGLQVTVKTLEEYVMNQKKQTLDFWTFVFRCFITIMITFIAYKVGLKP